jgi:small subunit ribosomal protein S1
VDVGGADGLIHISELSWKHVDNPGEILEVGQEIETLIIRLDRDANRIGLSLKRLQANPWHDLTDHIQVGMECDGLVTRQAASGAYVCVEDKVEGLIHSKDGDFLPTPGAKVRIRVLSLDTERERMDLEWMDPQVSMDENNKQGREVNTDADRGSAPE